MNTTTNQPGPDEEYQPHEPTSAPGSLVDLAAVSSASSTGLPLRDYRIWIWLGGDTLSGVGDQVASIALLITSINLLGPAVAGPALALLGLPRIMFSLWGGALADRLAPQRLLLLCHVTRAAALIALAVMLRTHPSPGLLLAAIALLGIGAALADPAARSLAPLLVKRIDLVRVIAARSTGLNLSMVIGAPMGGLLVSTVGLPTVLILDSASFLLASFALLPLPRPSALKATGNASLLREIRIGLGHAARNQLVGLSLVLIGVINLTIGGPVELGITQLAHTHRWQSWSVGVLLAVLGAAAMLTGLVIARLGQHIRRGGAWILTGVTAAATALLLMGTAPTYGLLLGAMAILGVSAGSSSLLTTLIQNELPAEMAGRISSLLSTIAWGTSGLSLIGAGLLIHAIGPRSTFLVAAVVLGVAVLACARKSPALRQALMPAP